MAMVQANYSSIDPRPKAAIKIVHLRKLNFAYSFRPIYNFGRMFGLMPFSFTYNTNGTISGFEIGTFDILWFIISLIINLVLAFMLATDLYNMDEFKTMSIILVGEDLIFQVICSVFNAISIGIDLCTCSKLVEILKKINNFDEDVC